MDILKYFADEPAALHAVSAAEPAAESAPAPAAARGDLVPLAALLDGPRYYRGYLAGTHLPGDGGPRRIGATALADPDGWTAPLLDLLPGRTWIRRDADGRERAVPGPASVLRDPRDVAVLVAVGKEAPDLGGLAGPDRREALPALRAALDAGAVVLFPEPAHDGFDWSVFAATPLRDRFVEALAARPAPTARRFVLPYRQARGEHRFYFEQWQLDALPDFVTEV